MRSLLFNLKTKIMKGLKFNAILAKNEIAREINQLEDLWLDGVENVE